MQTFTSYTQKILTEIFPVNYECVIDETICVWSMKLYVNYECSMKEKKTGEDET